MEDHSRQNVDRTQCMVLDLDTITVLSMHKRKNSKCYKQMNDGKIRGIVQTVPPLHVCTQSLLLPSVLLLPPARTLPGLVHLRLGGLALLGYHQLGSSLLIGRRLL